ncbi:MAG: hypothetical protein JWN24_2808 [Phycisphaerales bacterium]|nr:hypothetical protein [Phycisphaerales bacterium]
MDSSDRIIKEFDRLVALGRNVIRNRSYAEQVLYYVVVARCEADMEGFNSVYEQALDASELKILIEGLRGLGETAMAAEYARGLQLLLKDGFYEHRNWNRVSESVKHQITAIGERVGAELWGLDEKLVAMLNECPTDEGVGGHQ